MPRPTSSELAASRVQLAPTWYFCRKFARAHGEHWPLPRVSKDPQLPLRMRSVSCIHVKSDAREILGVRLWSAPARIMAFASAVRHGHSSEPGSLVTSRHGLLRGLRPGSNGQKVVAPEVYTRNASAESRTFKQSKERCVELSSQRVANNQDAIRRPRLSCAKNIQCIAQR